MVTGRVGLCLIVLHRARFWRGFVLPCADWFCAVGRRLVGIAAAGRRCSMVERFHRCSRYCVGWSMRDDLTANLVYDALGAAELTRLARRKPRAPHRQRQPVPFHALATIPLTDAPKRAGSVMGHDSRKLPSSQVCEPWRHDSAASSIDETTVVGRSPFLTPRTRPRSGGAAGTPSPSDGCRTPTSCTSGPNGSWSGRRRPTCRCRCGRLSIATMCQPPSSDRR